MHIAVAIVSYRNPEDVAACLRALERSTYRDFEVILCENGGPEAFIRLQERLPPNLTAGQPVKSVLAKANLGYAGGVNLCIQATPQAEAWWVLNPDTEPCADAMALQVERLQRGDCDAVGCLVQLPGGVVQSYGGRWQKTLARAVSIGHGGALEDRPRAAAIERQQNYLNGAAMFIGRSFIERAGMMCEDYFLYCEEVEWCLRGLQRGARLGFEPSACVLHHQGTTTGNVVDIRKRPRGPIYLNERNRLLLTRDRFPTLFVLAAVNAFAMIFLKYARRSAWAQVGFALSGWAAGLRNERGVPRWMVG